ncbi:MAG TPA: cupin domain-containing protein [Patescibacteria group bacterium]|nr:cupin domain-containing protein [Patescibacteria group bacterium]
MSYAGDLGEISATGVSQADMRSLAMKSGTVARFVATGTATRGDFGLYRWEMPPVTGGATGHFHRTFSESFYVLEGSPSFFDGETWKQAEPGFFLYVPRGGIHGFRNDSPAPATFLILFSPGIAREGYFEALAEIGATGRQMSNEDWADLYARFDQVMVD